MGGDGPRATPTIDGGQVFAMGATGILNCLDLETGEPVWSRNILSAPDQENLEWGKSCSPLVYGDLVVVGGGEKPAPGLLAYSRADGAAAWTSTGGAGGSYSSPVLAIVSGVRQVLSVNSASASGHEPVSGKVLWQFDWPGGYPKVGQPVPAGNGRILLSASYNVGSFLLNLIPADGGALMVEKVWRSNKIKTKFSSACVRGEFAYGLNEGRLVCVGLSDGKSRWKGERYGYGQNLLVGDLLLVQAERGHVVLVDASPEEFVERARLGALTGKGKTWNAPALAGNLLLVRNGLEAACYRLPLREDSSR